MVKQVASAVSAPLKLIGLVPKMPKLPDPVPGPAREDAGAAAIGRDDELRRRRGGAADVLLGDAGAEAGATGKQTLGS